MLKKLAVSLALLASMVLGAGSAAAQSNDSVDSSTLVSFTGTGWSISLPPGWGAAGPGVVGGKLADGTVAVIVVQSADAAGQGLDVLGPAAIQGMASKGTIGASVNGTTDGQSAMITDITVPPDSSTPGTGYGRVSTFIENGKFWLVAYLAYPPSQAQAGVDLFKNQLLPTFTVTG